MGIWWKALRGAFFGGLLLSFGPASAEERAELEIGYMPILPVSQLFVTVESGALEEAGIEVNLVQFQNGPAMVQALLAGQLDVAHLGIGPAMIARAKGAEIKVVAASIKEQISFVALGELAPYFKEDPATAFARFRADKGRKPVVTTFPVGSVPETVLQHWLRKVLNADLDDIEIIYQGAAQVQQVLTTGAVDGAAILEPIVTSVTENVDGAKVVARGSEMFEGQPGAVLVVREALIADRPELVEALVRAHVDATRVLNEQPDDAVGAVQKFVGGGRMKSETVAAALRASSGSFVADPGSIIAGTTRLRDFQAELGTLKEDVDVHSLIESRFFQAVAR